MSALLDSHLHLGRPEFDRDRDEVRARAAATGVRAFLHVGYDPASIEAALAQAAGRVDEWVAAGIHPHDAGVWEQGGRELLEGLAAEGRIVAIGECGLDFYRDLSPRPLQEEVFRAQIDLARRVDLPMIFHVRDAWPRAREILQEEGLPPRRGVFHAFAGDGEFARWAVSEGFLLGIGGSLSYRRARLPEAIAGLPASSFLLETDAPWLPPQPWRGKRNEPAYLRETAERLAAVCGLDLDELAAVVANSFAACFDVRFSSGFNDLAPSTLPPPQASSG